MRRRRRIRMIIIIITRMRADFIAPRIPPSRVEEKLPGKRETTTTTTRENKISKLGRAVLMVEIGLADAKTTLQRPSGASKTSQRRPQNLPKATFGSKKQANEALESSKTNLEAFFGRSRGLKELPRDHQESPKSSQKEPERASKRFQNHHWIENVDFSKMLRFLKENRYF